MDAMLQRRGQQGSSLVEVILALGLMAGVLASIAGLFIIGAGQVRSGRTATEALAVAGTILEELESIGYHQTYTTFGFSGSASSYTADTRSTTYATQWQPTLEDRLFSTYATISIASLDPGGPVLSSSTQMRVVVTVFWQEGQRQRSIRLGMVRM